MKKADNFDASKWLVENKITFQSRLTENQVNNLYMIYDEELSDKDKDVYGFSKQNALYYLRKYLYSKVVYPSGRSAWVWSNYVSILPQIQTEREALNSPAVPMAWVWSYYKPYLGFMTVNSDNRPDDQSTQSTVVRRTKLKQKKLRLNKTKNPGDRLTLMILGAVIAIVLI